MPPRAIVTQRVSGTETVLLLSIQLVFNDPNFAKLNFFARQNPDEVLDSTGNRKGTFEITVSVSELDLTIPKATFC